MQHASGFRALKVWQKSIELIVKVYQRTQSFPAAERYGLTSQMRRAAVSIAANIAEGSGRWTKGEYAHSLSIACGSVKEVETLSEVARQLGFMADAADRELVEDATQISRMLVGLQRRLR